MTTLSVTRDDAATGQRAVKRVDVLVTAYKRITFVGEAIASALAQTYPYFRVIVLDNSNHPEIRRICERFADDRLIYSPSEVDLGVVRSLARGIAQSDADYISILNDDDAWEPELLQTLVAALETHPNCDIAFCDHWLIDGEGKVLAAKTEEITRDYGRASIKTGCVSPISDFIVHYNGVTLAMGAVIRRAALPLDLFYPEIAGAYDLWLSLAMSTKCDTAYYCSERLTRYRLHAASETLRQAPDKFDYRVFLFTKVLELGFHPHYRHLFVRWLAHAEGKAAIEHLRGGERGKALHYALLGFPTRFNPLKAAAAALTMVPTGLAEKVVSARRRHAKLTAAVSD